MLKISPSRQVEKFLRNAHPKHVKQLVRKITDLRSNPRPQDIKKLANSSCLRVDSGEYRIIYRINLAEVTLEIILVGKRNDDEVYKNFQRLG